MNLHIRELIAIAGTAAITAMGTDVIRAQTGGPPERFTAVAVNIGSVGHMKSGRLEITVTEWCTDDDIEMLIGTLVAEGPDALLDALQETCPVGYLRMPDGMRYDLLFAQRVTGEEDSQGVILLADSVAVPPAAVEAGPIEYGFALIELRLNGNGEGEGEMSIATMVPLGETDDEYTVQSLRLLGVRSSRLPPS